MESLKCASCSTQEYEKLKDGKFVWTKHNVGVYLCEDCLIELKDYIEERFEINPYLGNGLDVNEI